jgi:hypothetical protein
MEVYGKPCLHRWKSCPWDFAASNPLFAVLLFQSRLAQEQLSRINRGVQDECFRPLFQTVVTWSWKLARDRRKLALKSSENDSCHFVYLPCMPWYTRTMSGRQIIYARSFHAHVVSILERGGEWGERFFALGFMRNRYWVERGTSTVIYVRVELRTEGNVSLRNILLTFFVGRKYLHSKKSK